MSLRRKMIRQEKSIQRILSKLDVSIGKEHKRHYDEIKFMVADVYAKYEPESAYTELLKYSRMHNLEAELKGEASRLNKNIIALVRTGLNDLYRTSYNGSFDSLQEATGLTSIRKSLNAYEVTNNMVAGIHWEDRVMNYQRAKAFNVEKIVKGGMYRGDTYRTIAAELRESSRMSANRSSLIARSEGKRVVSEAQLEVMDTYADKVPIYKTWETSLDERVRDSHKDMQGQKVLYDELFQMTGGGEAEAPGLSTDDSDNYNERCWMSIDVE